jgi:hypothetical protein
LGAMLTPISFSVGGGEFEDEDASLSMDETDGFRDRGFSANVVSSPEWTEGSLVAICSPRVLGAALAVMV